MWPLKKKQKSPAEERQRDYEALGKQVMALYDHINPDRKGLYRTAFLKGMVTGLGGVVGATVVVALLAWFLSVLGHVPFLGDISKNAQDTIQSSEK
jgi:hypothetical protein